MKARKMKRLIVTGILITLGLTACFQEKEDFLFRGLFVEFNAVSLSPQPESFVIPLPDSFGLVQAQVNLVGVHQSADETLSFSVAPESTAVPAKHYDLTTNTFVLPANSSFATIEFDILDAGIPSGETVELTLVLEGNERIRPSENYKRQTYLIFGN